MKEHTTQALAYSYKQILQANIHTYFMIPAPDTVVMENKKIYIFEIPNDILHHTLLFIYKHSGNFPLDIFSSPIFMTKAHK